MSDPLPVQSDSRLRRLLRETAFGIAVFGLSASVLLWLTGGFEFRVLGVEIRAHRPLRALWLVVFGAGGFVALGGRPSLSWTDVVSSVGRHAARWERVLLSWLPRPRTVAVGLAAAVCVLGALYGTKAGSGSDSYGYVSQADLWLAGSLHIEQPFAAEVPWPKGSDSFIPLAYKWAVEPKPPAIVPTYASGLPLLLAAAKVLGGQDAIFLVVPLLGGLLILATYGVGCRLASPGAGLIGAALVATSPAVMFMMMSTMTDVPVAAMWAAAFYLMLGAGGQSAFLAGLAAAVAVLIRPNLVPLAALAGLYYVMGLGARASRRQALRDGVLFTLGLLPGVIAVGAINNNLYGSPFNSGYGSLSVMFKWAHIAPNFPKYFGWLIETHTPVPLLGLVALVLPFRRLWPGLREWRGLVTAALLVFGVWMEYLAYLVFDAWWYLRFLLTAWPFMMVGVGAVAMAIWRPGKRVIRTAVTAGVISLLWFQSNVVLHVPVFDQWSGERRYVAAAQLVQRLTPPNSVVLSMQHSGTIRYYGGRMTMRYDMLDSAWLDRAIAWLAERGVATYLLVEDWEVPRVARRFSTSQAVAKLEAPPLAEYEHPGHLFLFDLSSTSPAGPSEKVTGVYEGLRAVRPAPPPTLIFRTRTN